MQPFPTTDPTTIIDNVLWPSSTSFPHDLRYAKSRLARMYRWSAPRNVTQKRKREEKKHCQPLAQLLTLSFFSPSLLSPHPPDQWVFVGGGTPRIVSGPTSSPVSAHRLGASERAPHTSSQKHAHDIACAHTRVPRLKVAATTATTRGSLKLLLLSPPPPPPFRDRSTPSPEPVRPALPRVLWFDRPSRDYLRPCGLERRLSGDGLVARSACLTFDFETEEFGVIVVFCFVWAMLSTV